MRIGLIAGNGQFPLLFSKAAKAKGFAVYVAAYINETDPGIKDDVVQVEWLHIGQLRRLLKFFKKNQIDRAVMLGGITKTRMFTDIRPDTKAIAMIAKMKHTHDDNVLRAFARTLEGENIKIEPSTFL